MTLYFKLIRSTYTSYIRYGAKTEPATSATIASLERTSFACSFDANKSNFVLFLLEMYLFPERVTFSEGLLGDTRYSNILVLLQRVI